MFDFGDPTYENKMFQTRWLVLRSSFCARNHRDLFGFSFLRASLPGGGSPFAFSERHTVWHLSIFRLHVSCVGLDRKENELDKRGVWAA